MNTILCWDQERPSTVFYNDEGIGVALLTGRSSFIASGPLPPIAHGVPRGNGKKCLPVVPTALCVTPVLPRGPRRSGSVPGCLPAHPSLGPSPWRSLCPPHSPFLSGPLLCPLPGAGKYPGVYQGHPSSYI